MSVRGGKSCTSVIFAALGCNTASVGS